MSSAVQRLLRQPASRRDRRLAPATLLGSIRLGDAALVALAGHGAAVWTGEASRSGTLPLALGLAVLLAVNLGELAGAYRLPKLKSPSEQAPALLGCLALSLLATTLLTLPSGADAIAWRFPAAWFLTAAAALLLSRVALANLVRALDRRGSLAPRIVVVGAGEQGQRLIQRLRATDAPVRLIGLFDDRRTRVPHYIGGYPVLGGLEELAAFAAHHPIDLVVVALPLDAEARLLECLRRLRQLPADVRLCPDLIGFHLGQRGVTDLAGVPLLNVFDRPLAGWSRAVKAAEDRLLAGLVLLVTGPLLLVIALAIKLTSKGPVLFRQERFGLNNRVIQVLKFRTMQAGADDGRAGFRQATRTDPRVTPLGRFLRRTSLDELPQFLNVLRGEMSIVGPRPHALAHSEAMAPLIDAYLARHRVKPGITGWAQVNGFRGETDTLEKMERRLEHDLYYVENWSLSLDFRIILRTLLVGFTHPNAY